MTTSPAAAPTVPELDGVPHPPSRDRYAKERAYRTAVKRRQDMLKARRTELEAQRFDAELQVAQLEAQLKAIRGLRGELQPDEDMVRAVMDEYRRQRIMVVSFIAALEALDDLVAPPAIDEQREPDRGGKR